MLEEIGGRYAHWRDKERRVMKNTLVEKETPDPGRAPRDRFYPSGMDDTRWQLLESVPQFGSSRSPTDADPHHTSGTGALEAPHGHHFFRLGGKHFSNEKGQEWQLALGFFGRMAQT